MKKNVELNSDELHFIKCACMNAIGVYDFNQTESDFKEQYGITKLDASKMIKNLQLKLK